MKKIKYILPIFGLIISLTSCNHQTSKIFIDQYKGLDSLILIDDQDLVKMINNKKDFIIALGERGCLTCSSLLSSLSSYIKEKEQIIYWIEMDDYLEAVKMLSSNQEYALNPMVSSASLLLFNQGKEIKEINYQEKIYETVSTIDKELSNYIKVSGYYNINDLRKINYIDEQFMYQYDYIHDRALESLIQGKEEHTILFTLTSCPDCRRLKTDFLDQYLISNNKFLYCYETDGLRTPDVDSSLYENFKVKYQFASYHNGRVPSFVTYKESSKIDMSVFINDTIEKRDDQFIITDSFYQESIGIKGKTKDECIQKSSQIQYPLIKDYLDIHL